LSVISSIFRSFKRFTKLNTGWIAFASIRRAGHLRIETDFKDFVLKLKMTVGQAWPSLRVAQVTGSGVCRLSLQPA
jgi:hypothetical protein